MTWPGIFVLAAAAYAFKAVGPLVVGRRRLAPELTDVLGLVAVPVLAALVLVQTLDGGGRLMIDARVPAMCVAAVLVWRRAPFLVVVFAAAATAALLRAAF
jgi:branched-subunit amino acid transport protein